MVRPPGLLTYEQAVLWKDDFWHDAERGQSLGLTAFRSLQVDSGGAAGPETGLH